MDTDEEFVKGLKDLEKTMEKQSIISFDPKCVRQKSNWSKRSKIYRFDELAFNPETLLNEIPDKSPKLHVLLNKIDELDKKDMKEHDKLFKHFIFSDLKSSSYGAKLIASALLAKGMNLGYNAKLKPGIKKVESENNEEIVEESDEENDGKNKKEEDKPKKSVKRYEKIELLSNSVLEKSLNKNFYLLSSVSVYDQPINVVLKKEILKNFNSRPDNIHGELARIIVMDSGFKEGIDLFDIKYVHIFEPSTVASDQKQVIGRGTRTCGQKGLDFHPQQGWPLHVFVYDLKIPDKLQGSFLGTETAIELYLKAMNLDIRLLKFASDLEKTTIVGSVDYELNKNIHSFSIPMVSLTDSDRLNDHLHKGQEALYNGGAKKLVIRERPPLIYPQPKRLGFEDMSKHIRDQFSEFKWNNVKMENLCSDKQGGGSGQIINFTPTQDFIRNYFTPTNPVKGMLLHHSVGTGKCHAKNTPILMYDGSIKMVQDVKVGEKLMGDNSTPRTILSLASGRDDMYEIIPVKGDKYTVNSEHILCLKYSGKGAIIDQSKRQPNTPFKTRHIDNKTCKMKTKSFKTREEANEYLDKFDEESKIIEIEVKDYFKLSESLRRDLKGYRKGVVFTHKEINFDPYVIGLWLGDDSAIEPIISNKDSKILKYLVTNMGKYGLLLNYKSNYDYRLSKDGTTKTNLFIDELTKQNLINNKHIPNDYKINSRDVRLKVLAGLIDSDGYYCKRGKMFSISPKSKKLTNDILYLARSLGFAAYSIESEKSSVFKDEVKTGIYNSISISGDGLDEIPTLLTRKKAEHRIQIKDALSTGITICPIGKGDYYGFTIDGNRRYLLGDFTVTHNTCSAIAAATTNFEKQGYTILWVTRTTLKSDIWKNMFDQVCNESIRNKIQISGLEIPNDQNKRMGLLSKAWSIRPMSYKQFSNLVSKKNSLYESLVKKNGKEDPLRNTLLIIDEAHKLYGGGDLSSIERPDMNALHNALMYSYQYSGQNSVKLLLMTATPITNDPMELIKLLNLCKGPEEQMPSEFDTFSKKYLSDNGEFTETGRSEYLDDIAGYVSYLNREKDARQFSQPVIQHIDVPIIADLKKVRNFDKKLVKDVLESDIPELKKQIIEKQKELNNEARDLDANRFNFLREELCDKLDGSAKKACNKIVKQNIRQLINEANIGVNEIREKIKEIKDLIKERNKSKQNIINNINDNSEKFSAEYEKYKETLLYQLKNKCSKKITINSNLSELIKQHPVIVSFDDKIQTYNDKIIELEQEIKVLKVNHKKRINYLKSILKQDLSELEHGVIKCNINDSKNSCNDVLKLKKKDLTVTKSEINKNIKNIQQTRKKYVIKIHKSIKKKMKEDSQTKKNIEKEEKKLRKTLRKQGDYKEEIQDEVINNLVKKYRNKILDDMVEYTENKFAEDKEKEEKRKAIDAEKKRNALQKKAEKELIHKTKKADKERERQFKKAEKESMRKTKKADKERERQFKKAEKERNALEKKNRK
jgi:hypothetical protein